MVFRTGITPVLLTRITERSESGQAYFTFLKNCSGSGCMNGTIDCTQGLQERIQLATDHGIGG